jgi:hypothetical protein
LWYQILTFSLHGFLLLPDTVCSCPFPAIFRSFPAVSLHFPAGSVRVPVRLRYQEPAGKTRFRARRFSRPEYCFRVSMFFRQVPAGICADPAGKAPCSAGSGRKRMLEPLSWVLTIKYSFYPSLEQNLEGEGGQDAGHLVHPPAHFRYWKRPKSYLGKKSRRSTE